MKYKHLVWDFDGTLFDTYPEIAHVIKSVLEKSGIHEDTAEILESLHVSLSATLKSLSIKHDMDYDELKSDFFVAEEIMNVEKAMPFSGAKRLIDSVSGYNFMVTNRGYSTFRFLESKDYVQYFKEILHAKSGFKLKPEPDTVMHLIQKHNLERSEMLFIGDRNIDIQCGIAAGIDTCYFDSHDIKNIVPATYYVTSLDELYDILYG